MSDYLDLLEARAEISRLRAELEKLQDSEALEMITLRTEIQQLRAALGTGPLPSVNWKDGVPYGYCPGCGRREDS
jgi:hypothetical protein